MEKLEIIKNALEDKKASDIKILDISEVSSVADYFVIAHGNNINLVQALADNVEEHMAKAGFEPRSKEGYAAGEWIIIDYTDIIVHIFHQEKRSFYDLERLWRDAKEVK